MKYDRKTVKHPDTITIINLICVLCHLKIEGAWMLQEDYINDCQSNISL